MRRSTVTLLVLVASAISFVAAIPVLYQGRISRVNHSALQAGYMHHRFADMKFVKLTGMENVTVTVADTLAIDIKENEMGTTEFKQSGDTLLVTGSGRVIVSVAGQSLMATNSHILLKGDLKRFDTPSISVNLTNSYLYCLPISQDLKTHQHLNELSITDNGGSVVEINGRFEISRLILRNVERFSCSQDVMMYETDISYDEGRDVKTMTCREGLFISSL